MWQIAISQSVHFTCSPPLWTKVRLQQKPPSLERKAEVLGGKTRHYPHKQLYMLIARVNQTGKINTPDQLARYLIPFPSTSWPAELYVCQGTLASTRTGKQTTEQPVARILTGMEHRTSRPGREGNGREDQSNNQGFRFHLSSLLFHTKLNQACLLLMVVETQQSTSDHWQLPHMPCCAVVQCSNHFAIRAAFPSITRRSGSNPLK